MSDDYQKAAHKNENKLVTDAQKQSLQKQQSLFVQEDEDDEEEDECFECGDGGDLVLCDAEGCGRAYHAECLPVPEGQPPLTIDSLPDGDWFCPEHSDHSGCTGVQQSGVGDDAISAVGGDAISAVGDDSISAVNDDAVSAVGGDAKSAVGDDAKSAVGDDGNSDDMLD